ncbi:5-methylcytosine rRNA methyltransferase l(2)10685 isoform X9 [Rhipicephalus microplus]|uniref:5-methylcytosine rRNA methyltransferase l(2)10685 isoform X9 n=1 Tax=Rhipicephalus microplus TaxID=6941 RepID=UPI00188740C8|nr:5-methylcytosine rRNA methyltransferase NSUN4-like [Rhipicephalus microplus]
MDSFTCAVARATARVLVHWHRYSNSGWRHYSSKGRPQRETLGTYRALRHFDEFYSGVFGDAWPSVRLALLCPNKPCALTNTLVPNVEDVEKQLRSLGALSLSNLCERRAGTAASTKEDKPATSLELAQPHEHEDSTSCSAAESVDQSFDEGSRYIPPNDASTPLMSFVPTSRLVYQEEQISEDSYRGFYKPDMDVRLPIKHWPMGKGTIFPGKLDVAMFAMGDISTFPPPRRCGKERLLDYYLMDGASVLPVLALDLQRGDELADLCAAPGGKLLAAMCTGLLGRAVACDASSSRVKRLRECLQSYLPEKQLQKVTVLHRNLLSPGFMEHQSFDKILLDVPCTNDRLSVAEDDNNWFGQKRLQERLRLPQQQMDMLCQALTLLRPGGSLVYSTCSLSPIQNDGVVHMALQQLKNATAQYVIVNLSEAFASLPFRFFDGCRYGQLALPYLPNNVGPLYVARIERIS